MESNQSLKSKFFGEFCSEGIIEGAGILPFELCRGSDEHRPAPFASLGRPLNSLLGPSTGKRLPPVSHTSGLPIFSYVPIPKDFMGQRCVLCNDDAMTPFHSCVILETS